MGTLKRLFRFRISRRWVRHVRERGIATATASQRDMDRLLELTWRERVARNIERRRAAQQRAFDPVNDALKRLGCEVNATYLKRQAL